MTAKRTEHPVFDRETVVKNRGDGPVGGPGEASDAAQQQRQSAEQPAWLRSGKQSELQPMQSPLSQEQKPRWVRWSWRPRFIFRMLKATYTEWSNDQVPRMGAALSYYTIFSIAPLLVIAIAIAGFVFGRQAVQGQIMSQIRGLVGAESARAVQTMIQSAHKPAHGVIATIVGVVVLLLGASGVFSEMQTALNLIWKVDFTTKTGVWNMIRLRFLSFGMVLGIGFLLLVSLMLSAALAAASKYLESYLHVPTAVFDVFDFLFSLFIIAGLMAMIFKLLPDVKIPWGDVWIGGILTAILFTIGKFLIGFYIGKSIRMSAYGAAGSAVIILAWIYYSAQLLYFGAEFTYVFSNQCGSQCAVNNKARLQERRLQQVPRGAPQLAT